MELIDDLEASKQAMLRAAQIVLVTAVSLAVGLGQPSGRGVISGVAIDSSNGDPVAKAVVTVTWQGTPRSWATQRTDSSGSFKFEGLPPGNYELRAAKPGLGSAVYGANSPRELGDLISLRDGETLASLKLRFFHSSSISGHVVDSDGDPVSNVSVRLLRPGRNQGERVLVNGGPMGNTDNRGEYKISNLTPGQYYLAANPQNVVQPGGPETMAAQFYPSARDSKDAVMLTLRGGENLTGMDFHLPIERAVKVIGRVTGVPDLGAPQNQKPAAMIMDQGQLIQVRMGPVEEGGPGVWSREAVARAPDFRFQAPDAPPGRYYFEANVRAKDKTYYASQIVDLHAGSGEIVLDLAPAVDLNGTLRVEGPDAPPLKNLAIQLVRNGGQLLPRRGGNSSAQPDADGHFAIQQVPPGEWEVNVNQAGRNFLKAMHYGDKDVLFQPFEVEAKSDAQLNIVLSTRTALVHGQIDSPGADPKRVGILLAPVGKYHDWARFYYSVSSEEGGEFRITGVAPGSYKIFALEKIDAAAYRTPEAADQLGDLGEKIEISEGATVEVHPKLIPIEKVREVLLQ